MQFTPTLPAATSAAYGRLEEIRRLTAAYDKVIGRSATHDLELLSMIEGHEDDLAGSLENAFRLLTARGFNLYGDSHAMEHYHQATSDHVSDALDKAGLLIPACAECKERVMHEMKCPNFRDECVDCCGCPDHTETYYAMHIGVVGGLLSETERTHLAERLAAAFGSGRVHVFQDGDNFHEWGETLDPDPEYLDTVAARSAHIVMHVPEDTDPDDVMDTVRAALPSVVWCTAEQINETGDPTFASDKPYVVSAVKDWSDQAPTHAAEKLDAVSR